jgi:FkbM family methyltransferase
MIAKLKRFIYKSLGQYNYLRLLQRTYFLSYRFGLLKRNRLYSLHYFVKNLIKKGDVVIDIGANLGYYSILFAEWTGAVGKVYSVEPVGIYNKIFLEKARKYPNIRLYPYALGLEEKNIALVSSPQVGYLSTGLPHIYNSEKDGKIENQEFRFEAQMKIPSVLFNDLERIDYIKCDVEGFEYTVLSDMKEIIRRCKPIVQVEVWPENEDKVLDLFDELKYAPCKLRGNQLVTISGGGGKSMPGDYIFIPDFKVEGIINQLKI